MPYGGNQRQPFGLCLGEQHAIEISQMLAALTNTRLAGSAICFLAFSPGRHRLSATPAAHGYPAANASFIS
jgi:hypothetical protein